ncbi:hypothetical protein IscW_ISCW006554 [Ixodes scapularis]|uniref:Uncharacterized protein n=1 Tax=Ixodes scapularis TaxID=6945 RepID=B7PM10_IXOSC|nr:hypothetical protein IscW_ISCW006554 [Ixodes scapularis]|eukprot:XP_002434808.1 hypothetical protein IscW_ISCW006554 [Ixodes scapularis]
MHLPVLLKLLNIISKHMSVVLRHPKVPVGSRYCALLGNKILRFLNRAYLWSLIRPSGPLLLCLLVLLVQNLGPPWILAYLLWSKVILLLQSLLGHSLPAVRRSLPSAEGEHTARISAQLNIKY